MPDAPIRSLPEVRQSILMMIKESGSASIAELARVLSVSGEAVRQQMEKLFAEGWVQAFPEKAEGAGRPARRFRLTVAGEHLFPKAYDALTIELIDQLAEKGGKGSLAELLAGMTDARVEAWAARMEGKSLEERLELLKGIYLDGDPFSSVERKDGELRLVERNCPFLSVAAKRPALCSLTVSVLSRLLGCRVERVESFQAGHGRCAFRALKDRPVDKSFRFAFEKTPPA